MADRATIANMAPEYGATMGFFPVDAGTLAVPAHVKPRLSKLVQLVEAYSKEQMLFRTDETPDPLFSDTLELDLSTVVPSMAGPKRPQDRLTLPEVQTNFKDVLQRRDDEESANRNSTARAPRWESGAVVIAAITSCTNTSNPSVMMGAGLLAKKAVEKGLKQQAMGEDEPGARIESRYRVSEQGRSYSLPRRL